MNRFDALAAPSEDGGLLIEPPLCEWPALIQANRRTTADRLFRPGDPARDAFLSEPPRILVGHQPEFMHPGVWAKQIAAAEIARRVGGKAAFLIADNDATDDVVLRWPVSEGGRLRVEQSRPDWPVAGGSLEQQGGATGGAAMHAWAEPLLNREDVPAADGLRAFLNAFAGRDAQRSGRDGGADYVSRWMRGIAAVDRAVGVATLPMHRVSTSSTLSVSEPKWYALLIEIAMRAAEFAAAHNEALAAYRAERGIRGTTRPIADLEVTAERVELPMWAWRGDSRRLRVYAVGPPAAVLAASDGTLGKRPIPRLFTADGELIARPSDLAKLSPDGDTGDWRIRPRAIALTMHARLYLCDFFVHGLGGAKYDAITDEIIRRFFGYEPPAYGCVTATLRLPLRESDGDPQGRLAALQRAARDALHNPQRVCGWSGGNADAGAWRASLTAAGRLMEWNEILGQRAAAIAESLRLRSEQPRQRLARRRLHEQLRSLHRRLAEFDPQLPDRLDAAATRARADVADASIARNREWFYALYPETALAALAARICAE